MDNDFFFINKAHLNMKQLPSSFKFYKHQQSQSSVFSAHVGLWLSAAAPLLWLTPHDTPKHSGETCWIIRLSEEICALVARQKHGACWCHCTLSDAIGPYQSSKDCDWRLEMSLQPKQPMGTGHTPGHNTLIKSNASSFALFNCWL